MAHPIASLFPQVPQHVAGLRRARCTQPVVCHAPAGCQLIEQSVPSNLLRTPLAYPQRQSGVLPADEMDGVDVTAGDVSPWHAAKPAQLPLSDACDAAAGVDGAADYSPMSDDAGGSISPQSDGGGGFFAAPPPLLYESAVMVPWGQGALRSRACINALHKHVLHEWRVAQRCSNQSPGVTTPCIERPRRARSERSLSRGCSVLLMMCSHCVLAAVQAQTQQLLLLRT